MTSKHFVLIAETIAALPLNRGEKVQVAYAFAHRLASTNARFDRERFLAAATATK